MSARTAIAVLARQAGMSPFTFHGRKRRERMGLIDTPGPSGVYVTPESGAHFLAKVHEVREARRANKK